MADYIREWRAVVARPRVEVFRFFAEPRNLPLITPPWLGFRVLAAPAVMTAGAVLDYRLRWLGLPLRWHSSLNYYPHFYGQWNGETHLEQISPAHLIHILQTEIGPGITEMSCHPGYVDLELPTSYQAERQAEIDRQKQEIIAAIRAREEDPGAVAQRIFAAALFPGSPYGRLVEGSEASVKELQQETVRQFFARHYRPNRSIMAVVGDVSEQEIRRALDGALRGWSKGESSAPPSVPSKIGDLQVLRVNRDITQANIILGHAGVARANTDYYAIQVMNYVLGGGGFSSRVMDSVRNERGLAYSVYSYFSAEKSHGSFQLVMQTKNETAEEAIRIAKEEIERIREQPVAEQELNDAKDYLIGSFPLRLDTNRKVASFLAQVEFFQLGLDYAERYGELIRKVSIADVQRVAKQYLKPDQLIVVTVGNQQKLGAKN